MKVKTINGYVAVVVLAAFLCQHCATIFKGPSQKIPVTCTPSGARVIVDDEDMGFTPMVLKLKRKGSYVIRIEKPGYQPVQLAFNRENNLILPLLGNFFLGGITGAVLGEYVFYKEPKSEGFGALFEGLGNSMAAAGIGLLLGWLTATLIDVGTGATYTLTPESVVAQLAEQEEGLGALRVSVEKIENGQWIRVRCIDRGKK